MEKGKQDCLFFEKVDGGNCWEPGCRIQNFYCECYRDHRNCRFYVSSSDQKHVADLLKCCVDHIQTALPTVAESEVAEE